MKQSDRDLLNIYMEGWNDCGDGHNNSHKYGGLELIAYKNGGLDFIVGDNVSSSDNQSEEEILKRIKED